MNDLVQWFKNADSVVAVLDATNSTKERRKWIYQRCIDEGLPVVFVESVCNDAAIIRSNVMEVKTTSPDYVGLDPEAAVKDFMARIQNYEKVYESIGEDENHYTYVKLIDVGKKIIANRIRNFLEARCTYFLIGLHIKPRSIWLSRVSRALA